MLFCNNTKQTFEEQLLVLSALLYRNILYSWLLQKSQVCYNLY